MTSYTDDYLNKGSPIRAERAPLANNKFMPEGRFEDGTTYTGAYIPGISERNPQIRPEGQLKVNGGNF
jgi:hypothetical protein